MNMALRRTSTITIEDVWAAFLALWLVCLPSSRDSLGMCGTVSKQWKTSWTSINSALMPFKWKIAIKFSKIQLFQSNPV